MFTQQPNQHRETVEDRTAAALRDKSALVSARALPVRRPASSALAAMPSHGTCVMPLQAAKLRETQRVLGNRAAQGMVHRFSATPAEPPSRVRPPAAAPLLDVAPPALPAEVSPTDAEPGFDTQGPTSGGGQPADDGDAAPAAATPAAKPAANALEAEAATQAKLIGADSLRTEAEIVKRGMAQQLQAGQQLGSVRDTLTRFFAQAGVDVRQFIAAKQAAIAAGAAAVVRSAQAVLAQGLQTGDALATQVHDAAMAVAREVTATAQGQVRSVALQITGVIRSVPLPDLPGVEQVRRVAESALARAAGTVTSGLDIVVTWIGSALNLGLGALRSMLAGFARLVQGALSQAGAAVQRIVQTVFQMLNQAASRVVSALQQALNASVLPTISRLQAAIVQALAKAQQRALAALRSSRDRHLQALGAFVRPAAGGADAPHAGPPVDGRAALQGITRMAMQQGREILQTFEERTGGTLARVFQTVSAAAAQIIQHITGVIASVLQPLQRLAGEVMQAFDQISHAIGSFVQSLIQSLVSSLARIVTFVRAMVQSPLDQLLGFAQSMLRRMIDFVGQLVRDIARSILGTAPATQAAGFQPVRNFLPAPAFVGPAIPVIIAVLTAIVTFLGGSVLVIGGTVMIIIGGAVYFVSTTTLIIVAVVLALLLLLVVAYVIYVLTRPAPPKKPPPLITGVLTPRDNFAGRSPVRFGVGEVVDLSFFSVPPRPASAFGGLVWHKAAGGGALTAVTNAGTAVYTAPAIAGTAQLELRIASGPSAGSVVSTHPITLAIPSAVNITEVPGTAPNTPPIPPGRWGAGFQGNVFVDPKDVSFQGVVFGEGTVSSVITGSFLLPLAGVHPVNTFGPGHGGNAATGTPVSPPPDGIFSGSRGPAGSVGGVPFCGVSDFLWAIPWEFSVAGGPRTPFAGGFTANHHAASTATCDATIEKGGAGPFVRPI